MKELSKLNVFQLVNFLSPKSTCDGNLWVRTFATLDCMSMLYNSSQKIVYKDNKDVEIVMLTLTMKETKMKNQCFLANDNPELW